jgi:hypothetical protein
MDDTEKADGRTDLWFLLELSVEVQDLITEAFMETIDACRASDAAYARYAGAQMHYYSSRCRAMNALLQNWMLWDSDIIFRSALECATRYLFVSIAEGSERHDRIIEYTELLSEIEDIHRTDKVQIAALNNSDALQSMLLSGAVLPPDRQEELRSRWPRSKRSALKQRWSFSEIVRVLQQYKKPTLDLTSYGSLLHSYSISSHLVHADQTAMTLMFDRATRDDNEREMLEQAHFCRLATEQTTLLFMCWRAMEHALARTSKRTDIAKALLELYEDSRPYHDEFGRSQEHLYKHL